MKELQAQARVGVAGHEGLNGAIEVQLQCKRCLGIARLAAVSHSRDGHSFNCKCSIPSSYRASHCPGIASIFGGPSGNRGATATEAGAGKSGVDGPDRLLLKSLCL